MTGPAMGPSVACLRYLRSTTVFRKPSILIPTSSILSTQRDATVRSSQCIKMRAFSTQPSRQNWLQPVRAEKSKSMVGRPRMPTGGSTRGTTVVWGDYGLRMKDHDRRVSAKQLRIGEETIRRRLRGEHFRLYTRVSANIGVYTKGSEVRMGKGKGKFDYWAARIPVSRIVFELKGQIHEQVARDAFRLAGDKLPGLWEFVKKGDPPVVGITKLGNGVTLQSLKEARRPVVPKDKLGEVSDIVGPSGSSTAPRSVSREMDSTKTEAAISP
ncbi:ribosomal protein L16 [Exophiala mesophila]|uniref:Ribosomal protein L16 n=1 Tax=Exophiala mesophila TaxID=212818 RepID=A0A0D1ZT08_EXOME|nr:ribosomal protein L16 [Exophiala mesophila]KIV97717.1 ribosomal protein L16 [Exophiala mesophila]